MDLILFFIVMFITLTYVIHGYWYFKDLEQFYPEVYKKLGSPFGNKRLTDPVLVLDFLLAGKYNHLLDKRFALGRKYLVIHFVVAFLAMVTFIIVLSYLEASSQTSP